MDTNQLQLENEKLMSCCDESIKIWTLFEDSFKCDYTIGEAHYDKIRKVISLTNNRMVSCSSDGTIKMWNSNHPYKHIKTFQGHTDSVNSIIQLKGKPKLISGSKDDTLRIWNLSTYKCEKKINGVGCASCNSLIEVDGIKLLVGGENAITIVDLENYAIEKINNENVGIVYSLMTIRGGDVLCGSNKGMAKFNRKSNTITMCDDEFNKKNNNIFDLIAVNDNNFLSCSIDCNIKVWEYEKH